MYWLTGYDSFGFSLFQCLVVTADGDTTLLTRLPDLRQARHTSNIENIRIWKDAAGMNPARDLRALLDELGLGAARLGVELDSYGLKAHHWRLLETELAGRCTLADASTPDRRSALREEPAGDRVRPPRCGARRRCLGRSGATRPPRRLRGRHPRRHAGRGVPRRGRLRRKRVHHRIGPGRSPVPVLQRAPAPRPRKTSSPWSSRARTDATTPR